MERLGGDYEVDAVCGKVRHLGRTGYAVEELVFRQQSFAGLPHSLVWLDAEHGVAILEKELAEETCARTDIRDDVAGLESQFLRQQPDYRLRVGRPIGDIVLNPIAEAFGRFVLEAHRRTAVRVLSRSCISAALPCFSSSSHRNWIVCASTSPGGEPRLAVVSP